METEAGFIVICLSESKLGNIFLVNEKACNIFRYSRKDILEQRVNAIMPRIFAVLHDKILTDFLKAKRRKFNTDQRLLFGKDGTGYMFPVQLQLQNTSFTSNDEYIFIAMVKPDKTREIPLYCIVDHEGYIRDYTASFKNIFYYQSRKEKAKNIQEIIPNYFDEDYSEEMQTTRTFTVPINNKKLGEIEAKFEIHPIFVKQNHEGFLIKMEYITQMSKFNSKTERFTERIA
jgi:PAS domain S-box-containing protein